MCGPWWISKRNRISADFKQDECAYREKVRSDLCVYKKRNTFFILLGRKRIQNAVRQYMYHHIVTLLRPKSIHLTKNKTISYQRSRKSFQRNLYCILYEYVVYMLRYVRTRMYI